MELTQLKDLLKRNRTYRRFDQSVKVGKNTLMQLVELTRYCASGRNAQPLKYRLVVDEDECVKVFQTLAWAGYYKDWDGPAEGERPTAYLVQCLDKTYGDNCLCDDGLQLEAITLGATTLGLGCCIIKAFKLKQLSDALNLPESLAARYVVAIGKPAETVILEDMDGSPNDSFKYYRDKNDAHHVPKRPLSELIVIDPLHSAIKVEPIRSIDDLEQRVQQLGFFPMFSCGIPGFSIYENTPRFWTDDEDGPWEWKGPMIQNGSVAYGKFFNRKAGYVSLEWLPDFLNYRRSKHLAPNDDAAAMDDLVLQTIEIEGRITIKELRQLLGLCSKSRQPGDLIMETEVKGNINLDTNLTRLMMEGRVCIEDFAYNIDKRGNQYGWGIAKYTTPELLYGHGIKADCSPQESYGRMLDYLKSMLRGATDMQIKRLLA